MTPDRNEQHPVEESENSVLGDTGGIDTTGFGILGGATEQVSVVMPTDSDDDLDDDVLDDEVSPFEVQDVGAETSDGSAGQEPISEEIVAEIIPMGDDTDSYVDTSAEVLESADEYAFASDVEGDPVSDIETGREFDDERAAEAAPIDQDEAAAWSFDSASTVEPEERVPTTGAVPTTSGSIPSTRRKAHHEASDRATAVERVPARTDLSLSSKRLGELGASRESADLLTADRLLDPHQVVRSEPEGAWQNFLYTITGHRVNLGDGKRARARKELDQRIAAPISGGARFVPVLSRKGGVGKTTVTTLLGMALADARDDRVIAVDANPDRGTLADRVARTSGKTVRDLVRARGEITGYAQVSAIVARDETRLDVLASDADPRVSEAFSDRDYNDVASLAAHYYSFVLTDTGTGIVHSVMAATLDRADQLVVVSGLSVDEARLASETLTWLETNGYAEQVRGAVVVLNNARPGLPLVQQDELETHFKTRVRAVVRVPYDPHIAAGSAITFRDLRPETRLAARELAATVVEGLRALAPAA
ncbi:MinD/ParA family ATP-binding protein [Microbacterium sp. P5_E9]